MLRFADEEHLQSHSWLAWVQALILALLLMGSIFAGEQDALWGMSHGYALVLGLGASQVLRLLLTRASPLFRFDWVDASLVLFLLYGIGRYLTASGEFAARLPLLNVLAAALLFWVCRYALTHSRQGIFLLVVAAGAVVVEVGARAVGELRQPLVSLLEKLGVPTGVPLWPFCEVLPDPSPSLVPLVLGVCMAMGPALFLRHCLLLRGLLFAIAIVSTVWLVWAGSLGIVLAVLAAGGVLCVACLRYSSLSWVFPTISFLIVVAVAVVLFFAGSGGWTRETGAVVQAIAQVNGLEERQAAWGQGLAAALQSPIVGVGWGNYEHAVARGLGEGQEGRVLSLPNQYVHAVAEGGLVAVVLLGLCLLGIVAGVMRSVDYRAPASQRIFRCAAGAVLVALLVSAAFEVVVGSPAILWVSAVAIGLGMQQRDIVGAHLPYGQRQRMNTAFALGLLAVLGWGASVIVPTMRSSHALTDLCRLAPADAALRLPLSEEQVALLNQAIAHDERRAQLWELLGQHLYASALAGAEESRRERAGLALEAWRQATVLEPDDTRFLLLQAIAYDLCGEYGASYTLLRELVREQPWNGFAREALVRHFIERRRWDRAAEVAQVPEGGVWAGSPEFARLQHELEIRRVEFSRVSAPQEAVVERFVLP